MLTRRYIGHGRISICLFPSACADESCSACADESLRSSETPGGWLGEEIPLLVVTGESKIVLLYSRHRNSKRTK